MIKKITAIAGAAALVLMGATSAQAVPYSVSATPTTGLHSGDAVTLTVDGLTGTVGVYASVCKAGATQMDTPTPCDNATTSWITAAGGGGSTAGAATFNVSSTFSTVDCAVDTCVIYVRGDHNNTSNYALIRAIPLTFAAGGPVLTPDSATAIYGTTTLQPNQAGQLKYRTPIVLNVTATSGLPVTLSSLTGDCVVTGNVVSALIGNGVCAIAATTAGDATYAPLNVNFPFYVGLGEQKVRVGKFNHNLRAGRALTIPNSTIKSSYDAAVLIKSSTPAVCSISKSPLGWRLNAKSAGVCVLKATSAASADLWTAAEQTLRVSVR